MREHPARDRVSSSTSTATAVSMPARANLHRVILFFFETEPE